MYADVRRHIPMTHRVRQAGLVRTYWVYLRDEISTTVLPRAFINVDRLSSGGAGVEIN